MYTNKAGKAGLSVREGSATFFRSCRFSLLDQRSLTLKHLFPAEVGGWAGGQAGGRLSGWVQLGRIWHLMQTCAATHRRFTAN